MYFVPDERPIIAFGVKYGKEIMFCEVYSNDSFFDIHFNHEYCATIEMDDDTIWIQSAGAPLPEETVDYIGTYIQHYYD